MMLKKLVRGFWVNNFDMGLPPHYLVKKEGEDVEEK